MQFYFDESRAGDPHALPDGEVFEIIDADHDHYSVFPETDGPGWYWWACFPGCLPDGDAIGPFTTQQEALDDAREDS